ncbi:MAG: TonB-dependent receptor [Deltaproteobacteria bacterium]|nr:TonB-dependent receptor [Deltaproteobacteria bacterium]
MKFVCWFFLLVGGWGLAFHLPLYAEEAAVGRVVVTATRTEAEIGEVPQAWSVISRREIQNAPDSSLAEIIGRAAGVEISRYGSPGSVSLAKIRGSDAEQVLILIDGRRVNDPQAGKFDLSGLPLNRDDIERIEVLRGAGSALYGADALGGIVNIVIRLPAREPSTRLSASYGRFDTQEYSFTQRWKPGPVGYGISLSKARSQGHRPNGDYDAWTLGGEIDFEPAPRSDLRFSARTLRKEIGLPGPIALPDPDDRQKDSITWLDLAYRGQIKGLDLSFRGFQNIYRRTFDPGRLGFNAGPPFLHKNYSTGGDLQATSLLGSSHLVTAGLESIQDRVDSSALGVHRATRGAVYLQDEMEILRPLTATLGLRYDHHSIYGGQWNPRGAMLLRLPGDARLRGAVARSYRAPTFDDLYWPEDAFVAGNRGLRPEEAWSYEIGGEKNFAGRAVLKAAGFLREVDGLILWAPGMDGKWRPANIRAAQVWGAEAEVAIVLSPSWTVPLNYSYLYPRDEETGGPIPFKPKHILNLGLEYAAPRGIRGGLRGRYVRYYLSPLSTMNRDYFVLEARAAYDFKIWEKFRGEAFLHLANALNRGYEINEGYPMPPRSLSGGVSLWF